MKRTNQHNEYPPLHFPFTDSDHGETRFCTYEKSMQPLKYPLYCLRKQMFLHNGSIIIPQHKTQTGTAALAGKTAGGIRVCLDSCLPAGRFFATFFIKKKSRERKIEMLPKK